MPSLNELRQQYPQYNDLPDDKFVGGFYNKFYSDMPRAEFDKKIGYSSKDAGSSPLHDFLFGGSTGAGGSFARATQNLPGSVEGVATGLWNAVMHPADTAKSLWDEASGGFPALRERYGSVEKFQKTFEDDPAGTMLDAATLGRGGSALARKGAELGARGARAVIPTLTAKGAGLEEGTLRTAGEAGRLGDVEAAEYKAGLRGQPSPAEELTRGAQAAPGLAYRGMMEPYGQAGRDIAAGGFAPNPKMLAATGAAALTGNLPVAAGGAGMTAATSPRAMGSAMYGLGAAERGLAGTAAAPTRSAIVTGAAALLKDREAKKDLPNEDIKILRSAARDTEAGSKTMLAASRILDAQAAKKPPSTAVPSAYGGSDVGRSLGGAQAVLPQGPQAPPPGQASQPGQPPPTPQAALMGQQALPLPGQSPGLGRQPEPLHGEPLGKTPKGVPFMEFIWKQMLEGGEDLSKRLKEAGRSAFFEPEKFDPKAPVQAAQMAMGRMPFAGRGQAGVGGGALITPEGLAVPGREFSKASSAALKEIKGMPKGAGPLETTGQLRSDVPQTPVPRYEPPRGVSERMQDALANPQIVKGVQDSMRAGMRMGAQDWYLNEPIRQAFIKELGPRAGANEFARYMDYTAATSPRSDVPTNIRNASYYYLMHGRELPSKLPYPYGHMAQALHRSNIGKLEQAGSTVGAEAAPQFRGWDVFENPKPVSFSENLQGNLTPIAADTHAVRNITMRTGDPRFLETQIQEKLKEGAKPSEFQRTYGTVKETPKGKMIVYRPQDLVQKGRMSMEEAQKVAPFWAGMPRESEYGAVEKFYSDLAEKLKLAPAQGQSAAWSGAGELTGLGTVPDQTFLQMFNNRVLYTAMMRGENPMTTLRAFIRKQKPLLGFGGAGLLGAKMMQDQNNEPARTR
jgi:hypothetical protein